MAKIRMAIRMAVSMLWAPRPSSDNLTTWWRSTILPSMTKPTKPTKSSKPKVDTYQVVTDRILILGISPTPSTDSAPEGTTATSEADLVEVGV